MVLLKRIEEFPNYMISLNGEIWSNKRSIFIQQCFDKGGYLQVSLYKDKKIYSRRVHRLLAEAFLEHVHGCDVINHKDRNRTNNKLENLEWTTPRGNNQNMSTQSGYGHNIYFRKGKFVSSYIVGIYVDGNIIYKSFRQYEEAIEYRDSFLSNV